MRISLSYLLLVTLFVLCSLGYWFFLHEILFFVYGFDQSLISSSTADSFEAYRVTYPGRKVFWLVTLMVSLGTAISSYYVSKKNHGFYKVFTTFMFYIGMIGVLMSCLVAAFFFIIPTNII